MTAQQKADYLTLLIQVFENCGNQADLLSASAKLEVWIDKQIDDAVMRVINVNAKVSINKN